MNATSDKSTIFRLLTSFFHFEYSKWNSNTSIFVLIAWHIQSTVEKHCWASKKLDTFGPWMQNVHSNKSYSFDCIYKIFAEPLPMQHYSKTEENLWHCVRTTQMWTATTNHWFAIYETHQQYFDYYSSSNIALPMHCHKGTVGTFKWIPNNRTA